MAQLLRWAVKTGRETSMPKQWIGQLQRSRLVGDLWFPTQCGKGLYTCYGPCHELWQWVGRYCMSQWLVRLDSPKKSASHSSRAIVKVVTHHQGAIKSTGENTIFPRQALLCYRRPDRQQKWRKKKETHSKSIEALSFLTPTTNDKVRNKQQLTSKTTTKVGLGWEVMGPTPFQSKRRDMDNYPRFILLRFPLWLLIQKASLHFLNCDYGSINRGCKKGVVCKGTHWKNGNKSDKHYKKQTSQKAKGQNKDPLEKGSKDQGAADPKGQGQVHLTILGIFGLSGPLRFPVQSLSRTRLRIAASIAFLFRACFTGVLDIIAPLSRGWACQSGLERGGWGLPPVFGYEIGRDRGLPIALPIAEGVL